MQLIHTLKYEHTYMLTCMFILLHNTYLKCIYTYIIHTYVCMYDAYMYACMYVCMHVCINVCMYVSKYVYIRYVGV